MVSHLTYMQEALALAAKGRLTVSPNPMVGCVIVKDGKIVGRGFHQKAGEAHAEIFALKEAGHHAHDADVYLTLEPCNHHGRTPPCVDALIKASVKNVYIACKDPNPLVNGSGIEKLRTHGINVELGILEKEATKLNTIFFHYIQKKRPFVIAKWAMSLDGKTVTNNLNDRNITQAATQENAHAIRQSVDAILIGANTALLDNPKLTVRLPNQTAHKQPLRIILATRDLPPTLNIFDANLPGSTLLVRTEPCKQKLDVETLIVNKNSAGLVDLHQLLSILAERGISSLLIEGGMTVHQQFLQEKLVDQVCVYLAPIIIGDKTEKIHLQNHSLQALSTEDYCLTAGLTYV